MSDKLDEKKIQQIATLARLELQNESENHKIREDITRIMQMVAQISKIDTSNVLPMAHPLDMPQPLRKDEVTQPNEREKFLKLAPLSEAGLYLVPPVLEE